MLLSLQYHKESHKIISFEALAKTKVTALVNLLTAAISREMTIKELAVLDIACLAGESNVRNSLAVLADICLQHISGRIESLSLKELVALKKKRIICLDKKPPAIGFHVSEKNEIHEALAMPPEGGPLVFLSEDSKRAVLACQLAREKKLKAYYLEGGYHSFT